MCRGIAPAHVARPGYRGDDPRRAAAADLAIGPLQEVFAERMAGAAYGAAARTVAQNSAPARHRTPTHRSPWSRSSSPQRGGVPGRHEERAKAASDRLEDQPFRYPKSRDAVGGRERIAPIAAISSAPSHSAQVSLLALLGKGSADS